MISWKPLIVSSILTYSPGVPVNCSATKFGCERNRWILRARRRRVVLLRDDARLQSARERVERVDRRVDPLLDEGTRQHDRGVEVRERVRGRRVGEIVRR